MRTPLVAAALAASVSLIAACSSDASSSSPSGGGSSGASFNKDVFPIFVASCSLTACHGSKQSNLGIYLPNEPSLLYAELQKTSPTANKRFIVPGDPAGSYLMQKIDGTQCATCGEQMPQSSPLAQKPRDTIRAWIAAGAKND